MELSMEDLNNSVAAKLQQINRREIYVAIQGQTIVSVDKYFTRSDRPLAGDKVGKYSIPEENNRTVVIKKFNARQDRTDFSEEIRLSLGMNHANVIRVCDELLTVMDSDNIFKTYFLVLEFCQKGALMSSVPLDKSRKKSEPNDVKLFQTYQGKPSYELHVAKEFMRQALAGLNYLHCDINYVHLDIKPMNILLKEEPKSVLTAKLIDFGNCKRIRDNGLSIINSRSGTFGFIPPELMESEAGRCQVDGTKCDVFAMGITYCIMLTGKLPFRYRGNDAEAYLAALGDCGGTVDFSLKAGSSRKFLTKFIKTPPFMVLEKEEMDLIRSMCASDPADRPTVDDLLNGYFST